MLKTSSATKTYHKNITTDILSLLNPANPHGVSSNMMSHADVSCRFHFYMFCIRTFDASDESSREVSSADMDSRHLYHGYAREILVRGMADSSRSIRAKIKNFWHGSSRGGEPIVEPSGTLLGHHRLGQTLSGRIRELLLPSNDDKQTDSTANASSGGAKDGLDPFGTHGSSSATSSVRPSLRRPSGLYNMHSESHWLEYSSFLTLSLVEGTPDYERYLPGCEDALADCQFLEISLDRRIALSTYREGGASMQPKYASVVSQIVSQGPTAMSQYLGGSQDGGSYEHYGGGDSGGRVLATQDAGDMRYVATQAGGGGSLAVQLENQHLMMLSMRWVSTSFRKHMLYTMTS